MRVCLPFNNELNRAELSNLPVKRSQEFKGIILNKLRYISAEARIKKKEKKKMRLSSGGLQYLSIFSQLEMFPFCNDHP